MSIFEQVKQAVGTRAAAEMYGIRVNGQGRALCPFHQDHHPSMRLYEDHYHCFACGAHGDSVDLAAGIFGLTAYEAAKKLAADFGLTPGAGVSAQMQSSIRKKAQAQQFREDEGLCIALMGRYYRLLSRWMEEYRPASPGEEPCPRFLEACNELGTTEYALDQLMAGDPALVRGLMADGKMDRLEQRLNAMEKKEETNEREAGSEKTHLV